MGIKKIRNFDISFTTVIKNPMKMISKKFLQNTILMIKVKIKKN